MEIFTLPYLTLVLGCLVLFYLVVCFCIPGQNADPSLSPIYHASVGDWIIYDGFKYEVMWFFGEKVSLRPVFGSFDYRNDVDVTELCEIL